MKHEYGCSWVIKDILRRVQHEHECKEVHFGVLVPYCHAEKSARPIHA